MSRAWIAAVAMLATVIGGGSTAAAGEVTSAGPLGMSARDDLVLGRDATVTVQLRTAAEAELRLFTSAGVSSELIGDRTTAELGLPATGAPQVVIVAAIDRNGAIVDWLAIPLAARARLKVETERRADVVVEVAGREFGPVRADRSGIAYVEIIVPPGLELATTRATDGSGNMQLETVSLGTLPAGRVLTACAPDGSVQVVSVTAVGAPSHTAPLLGTSRGNLGPIVEVGPGVHEATLDLAELTGDDVVVTATAELSGNESRCRIELAPPPPPPPPPFRTVETVAILELLPARPRARPRPPSAVVALRAGWIDNLGLVAAPTLAVDVSVALPVLGGRLRAGLELGGYQTAVGVATEDGDPLDLDLTAMPMLARLLYRAPLGPVDAWTGLGGGLMFAQTTLRSAAIGMQRDAGFHAAGSLFAGGSVPVGPGAIAAELGYLHARTDTGDVRGRLGGVVATLGFALAY